MWSKSFFYLGLGTLLSHELDAVANAEWRVLPLLRGLPDDIGMTVFTLAHAPLVAWLLYMAGHTNRKTRARTQIAISLFLIFHAGLHFLFSEDPSYEFSSWLSHGLIYGGGLFGLAHLLSLPVSGRGGKV